MKYYIFIGISITVFMMGVIVYPTIHTVNFDDYSSHNIPTALANIPQISSEGENLKFINFSYTHTVGEPIQFILEKTRDRDCNSYNAKITDKDGNFIWSAGAEISCDSASIFNLMPVQTEIGYRENKPIIINESGRYYLEVEFIDAFTKREFVVRQNHGGGTLDDPIVYPVPFDMPSPHKQMELGIKLGHIICDKDKVPVWNTHYKPACVFSDTELELVKRGWAKLRLMLPAGPDPEKEMDWMGRNVMSMMLEGTFSYNSTPVETLDEKRKAIGEYSEQYHQGEQYSEYAITPYQYHYNVGDKVQFDLLEWGISSDCSNLQLRIIDMYEQSMFEHVPKNLCVSTDVPLVIFNSYSMGDYFEEFVCDKSGYYRIEVSNGDVFSPNILQNFACLDSESEVSSLRPDDRLQITHSAGYTTVYITLSSWDEYYEWEKKRGTEHDAMPPVIIDDDNINPVVYDLLNEMWKFEDYEVSKRDINLFTKKIQKDYSVPNHHGISDWLEFEYEKQFGKSNDGVSHYFEYEDKVYTVIMLAVD